MILAGSRIASVRAANVLYYHRDWQGSVVATTYTGGNVGVKYRYTPYGQLDRTDESISNAASASEQGYTGGLRLGWAPITGTRQGDLLLLGARVYDAALKRWLQPDTADVLRYTYTSGDPVNLVDPSGREPVAPVPSAADWSHAAERPPSWVAFRGEGVEPGTVEGDPNCKSGPAGPECRLPPADVPWPGKSPQQLKDEAERDLREFSGSGRQRPGRQRAHGGAGKRRRA